MLRIVLNGVVALLSAGSCAANAQEAPVQVAPQVSTITCMSPTAGTKYTPQYYCADQMCGGLPYFDPGTPVVATVLSADVATNHFNLAYAEIFKQSSKLNSVISLVGGRVATLEASKTDPVDAARLKLLEAKVKELEELVKKLKK